MEKIKDWINNNSGYGYGFGDGSGSGYNSGYGFGDGFGSGDGSGDGCGYGYGSGDGDGNGYGSGDGDDNGNGYGYGGRNIKTFNGKNVYVIDDMPTIIEHIKESYAKGYILKSDFTLEPCYVVKGRGYFAHGETIKEAAIALQIKIFSNMDTDEVIGRFLEIFKKGESYSGTYFYEWHHYLTGSCEMGRKSFVSDHGLDLNSTYTVDEFIDICKDAYGSDVIKQLKEKWEEI